MVRLAFGLVFGIFTLALGFVFDGGHPELLFRTSSAFIVIGGALGATLMSFPISVWKKSFSITFGFTNPGKTGTADVERFFHAMGRNFLLAGLAGFLFGMMHVFQAWEPAVNAGGFAVALTAPIQAVLLKLFFADAFRNRLGFTPETKRESFRRAA